MNLRMLLSTLLLVTIFFIGSKAFAQGADQQEMMKKWDEYMTPGPAHQEFAKMAGNWKATVTNYDPSGQTMKSDGSAAFEMVLGGRYMKLTFKSSMMGMPLEGLGYDAYDNATKEYISIWMDTFGTGLIYLKGKMDEKTKSIIYSGTSVDPMSGKEMQVKTVMKKIDENHCLMEMYMIEEGKEIKNMEIDYTRVK